MKVGIIGFGDLGQQFYNFLVDDEKLYNAEFFVFDDKYTTIHRTLQYNTLNAYTQKKFNELTFFVGLGYKRLDMKKSICQWLAKNKYNIGTYIHPSCVVHPSALIKHGVFIYPNCVIDQRVTIEDGVLLNNSVVISHDTIIGSNCFLAPRVTICGKCNIGKQSFLGAGTLVSDGVKIGNRATIGIGTVITKDIANNQFVIGNPMKIKQKFDF
jgi:sugar O-acyltransferase (sialic acid O-acetyltransferase NeuD family)